MKVKDFESAIEALNGAIFIDEMVIQKGQHVKAVYGHGSHVWIKWDEFGRSFTCYSVEEIPEQEVQDPRNEVEEWERSTLYDLKFV